MQWSMITEVCDIIDSDDAVVIGRKNLLGHLLLHPIKEITGAAVFPEFECTTLPDQLKQLDEQYDTVYLIYTTEQLSQGLHGLSAVYKSTIESSEDVKHEKLATSWFRCRYTLQDIKLCVGRRRTDFIYVQTAKCNGCKAY